MEIKKKTYRKNKTRGNNFNSHQTVFSILQYSSKWNAFYKVAYSASRGFLVALWSDIKIKATKKCDLSKIGYYKLEVSTLIHEFFY